MLGFYRRHVAYACTIPGVFVVGQFNGVTKVYSIDRPWLPQGNENFRNVNTKLLITQFV